MKALKLLVLIFACTLLASCSSKINAEKEFYKETNIPYSIRSQLSTVLTMDYAEQIYGKPDIIINSSGKYTVKYMDDSSNLVISYNYNDIVRDIWRYKKEMYLKDFNNIIVNKSKLEDVKRIDPYCSMVSVSTNKYLTEHRLADGDVIYIYYIKKDNSRIVSEIKYLKSDVNNIYKQLN